MTKDDPQMIEALLRQLTEWQRMSGIDPSTDSDVKSTGESNAAIEDLKRKLDQLGVRYHWSESARAYRLDAIQAPAGHGGKNR